MQQQQSCHGIVPAWCDPLAGARCYPMWFGGVEFDDLASFWGQVLLSWFARGERQPHRIRYGVNGPGGEYCCCAASPDHEIFIKCAHAVNLFNFWTTKSESIWNVSTYNGAYGQFCQSHVYSVLLLTPLRMMNNGAKRYIENRKKHRSIKIMIIKIHVLLF